MLKLLIDIFAGLGLFFVGLKLIGANLKEMTGGWFRRLILQATRHPVSASLVGTLAGAITQSTNAVTFISVSMVTSGVVDSQRLVPVVVWASVGTSALVLLSAVDITLFVLFLIGATGVAYYFDIDRSPRFRHAAGAMLGIGLLFLGLQLIKLGAAPIRDMPTLREFISLAASSGAIALLTGTLVSIVTQSSSTVSIIAVTMSKVGLLNADATMLIVIGASLGSGLSIAMLSSRLSGVGRQIAWMQVLCKCIGVAIVLPIFLAEQAGWIPGIQSLTGQISSDVATQAALVFLLLQLAGAIPLSMLRNQAMHWMSKLSPPSARELLSRPKFLYPEALSDAPSALGLVAREQARLVGYMPRIVDSVRSVEERSEPHPPGTLCGAGKSIAGQCDAFLADLLDRNDSREVMVAIVSAQRRNELLLAIFEVLQDFTRSLGRASDRNPSDPLGRLAFSLGESLHSILCLADDAIGSGDATGIAWAQELSSDRSEQMEQIRRRVSGATDLPAADHELLHQSTMHFERALWLLHRYLRQLAPAPPAGEARD